MTQSTRHVPDMIAPSAVATRLAVLLSPAVRIEPELIRAVRLAVLPSADVGVEAELWFSDWIATRSVDAVTLLPEVLPDLRRQLRAWIRASDEDHPVHRIWSVLDHVHATTPPALRLEEEIARLWLLGEHAAADSALGAAVHAVAEGRDGITDWFAGAWRRLPADVRSSVSAWQLLQVAVHNRRMPGGDLSGTPVPHVLTTRSAAVIAAAIGDIDLGVRRHGATLTLGEPGGAGAQTIRVPDTRPRLVDVIRADAQGGDVDGASGPDAVQHVAVAAGAVVHLHVGAGPIRLRTARGAIYELGPTAAPLGRLLRIGFDRLALPWRGATIPETLRPVVRLHQATHRDADVGLLVRAYHTAEQAHEGQYRKSGEPYIAHSLAVARLLAELGVDSTTVAAGLLHGTIEHTGYTLERLRAGFGPAVTAIVDGVTKLERMKLGDAARAETIRKLVIAMAQDARVLVVKLADRLENMRTVSILPRTEREYRAGETLDILVPLASRLGMGAFGRELSDLAFRTLLPDEFAQLHRLVSATPDDGAQRLAESLRLRLAAVKIRAQVTVAPPHLHAIYQQMVDGTLSEAAVRAMTVLRILVDTEPDCYMALGAAHVLWPPVPGRFRDMIAVPEFRMHRSLHTAVLGPSGAPVELQIRTHSMHRDAEYGIATLWHAPADQRGGRVTGDRTEQLTWLRQLLDWQREASDPSEFLDALRFELSGPQICVFTPKGDVMALPAGSTPVDFAYAVHTEVGHRCVGARVNGKLVPLESVLSEGDTVEIFTSRAETAGPTQTWLAFVASQRARTKIRQYVNKEPREEAIEAGEQAIAEAMSRQGLPLQRLLTAESLTRIAQHLLLTDVAALYAAVGEQQVSAQTVVQRLLVLYHGGTPGQERSAENTTEPAGPARPPRTHPADADPGVEVVDVDDMRIRLGRCCTPVPGDAVFGFVTGLGTVTVHREDCANAADLRRHPERVLEVRWKPTSASVFVVAIQVEALDRQRLLADITLALSAEDVHLLSASVTTTRDRVAVSRFSFEMADPRRLNNILAAVRRIDGVYDAYRVTGRE